MCKGLKAWLPVRLRKTIPRTNILTDVATENPVIEAPMKCIRNFFAQFYRKIGDTFLRVEFIGLVEGACRTSIDACGAGAAMICRGLS